MDTVYCESDIRRQSISWDCRWRLRGVRVLEKSSSTYTSTTHTGGKQQYVPSGQQRFLISPSQGCAIVAIALTMRGWTRSSSTNAEI
jgi:hypothetical protein